MDNYEELNLWMINILDQYKNNLLVNYFMAELIIEDNDKVPNTLLNYSNRFRYLFKCSLLEATFFVFSIYAYLLGKGHLTMGGLPL